MAQRLTQLSVQANWQRNPYLSDRRAKSWKEFLASNPSPAEKSRRLKQIVTDFIRANENMAAIQLLDTVNVGTADPGQRIRSLNQLEMWKGIAWLRLGERKNCIRLHSAESCILPIRGGGIHQDTEGSRRARDLFLQILQRSPEHLDALWLANISAMTLGEFPDSIPNRFRISPGAFGEEKQFPRFDDVAGTSGAAVMGLAGGGALADFNNDNVLDLFVTSMGLDDQARYLPGRGDGSFSDRSEAAGLRGLNGGLNLIYADYDNDDDPDILILRGAWMMADGRHPNSLLRNNGDGTFTDVTEAAGLLSFYPTQAAVWFDADNDGWIDLFVGNEPDEKIYQPCEFYLNNGDGTFREAATESGLEVRAYIKGVTSADYDNDGRADLFLSVYDGPNHLFRNEGPDAEGRWRFADVTAEAGVAEPLHSFPCWFWDYDNDGWEDLFVAGYDMGNIGQLAAAYLERPVKAVGPRLYRNNRKGGFEDMSSNSGITKCFVPMGVNYGDLDNDGFLDFYIGTGTPDMSFLMPNRMYHNIDGESFEDVTTTGGFGHLQKGHAVSFGDYDNDGDQDVHAVMGGAYTGDAYMNALFRNPGNENAWVKLKLSGRQSNRSAIGARLHLILETPRGDRHIHRTVGTGGSFGCNPLRQEVGLGNAVAITSLKVTWPGPGRPQVFTGLSPRKFYEIIEGKASPTEITMKTPAVNR
jgi:hypothetical protein